jgi:hypothetical protein
VAHATALLRRYRDNLDLNAFITVNEEAVLEAGSIADSDRVANKPLGPLHGVPIAVKDSINANDLPTSVGTKILAGIRPKQGANHLGRVIFGMVQFLVSDLISGELWFRRSLWRDQPEAANGVEVLTSTEERS